MCVGGCVVRHWSRETGCVWVVVSWSAVVRSVCRPNILPRMRPGGEGADVVRVMLIRLVVSQHHVFSQPLLVRYFYDWLITAHVCHNPQYSGDVMNSVLPYKHNLLHNHQLKSDSSSVPGNNTACLAERW